MIWSVGVVFGDVMEMFLGEEEEEATKEKRRAGNGQEAELHVPKRHTGHGARGSQGGSWTLG